MPGSVVPARTDWYADKAACQSPINTASLAFAKGSVWFSGASKAGSCWERVGVEVTSHKVVGVARLAVWLSTEVGEADRDGIGSRQARESPIRSSKIQVKCFTWVTINDNHSAVNVWNSPQTHKDSSIIPNYKMGHVQH